ncbi:hypothetical protein HBI31_190500 [Parastagonospora nodorum]|nr:hypothetical protein HBI31_190500 [Parastagonospora nodorum]KAH6414000.1 hypothetical protein HBI08_124210 [Parastagonospora nodorum]KAH6520923.1 hypothetical protein HBI07_225190 [Parastagonospora nodorum]
MALSKCIDDEVDSYPPPIPRRHPLRQSSLHQASRAPTRVNVLLSSMTPSALPKPDVCPNDTRHEPVGASHTQTSQDIYLDNGQAVTTTFERAKVKANIPSNDTLRVAPARRAEDNVSLASTKSSLTDGLKRYSSFFRRRNTPILPEDNERQARQHGIENAVAKLRQSMDISDTLSISSYGNGDAVTQVIAEYEHEDTRVEAWLQRGAQDAQAPESDCTSAMQSTPATPTLQRPRALTIFPPASPVTGKREYASPLSPMNNGRDAYGNLIPTNTQDYFDTPLSPTPSKLQSVAEGTTGVSKSSLPSLRGGGGWWNNLGIYQAGKHPVLAEQKSNTNLGDSVRKIAAEISKGKGPIDIQGQSLSRLENNGEDPQVRHASPRITAPSHGQSSVRVDDGWSEPTDLEIERLPPQTSKRWEPSANAQFGSVQNIRKDTLRTQTPSSPISPNQIDFQRDAALGKLTTSYGAGIRSLLANTTPSVRNDFGPNYRKPMFPVARPTSPVSQSNYSARPQKRWDNDQITRSPPQSPLPPPPPHSTGPANNFVNSAAEIATRKYWQECPPSEAGSFDEIAYELQSLQLGESVSVAGRVYAPRAVPIQQANQTRPDNFEERQKEALVRFLPLCRKAMSEYNEHYSKYRSALQNGNMSIQSYDAHMGYLASNIEKSLIHSSKTSGYVILKDENSILNAMDTSDGYAVYQDMLHTTDPALWQRLEDQYQLAHPMQNPIQARESNSKTARRVGGKISRFLLAAPSDPDLKTHSTKRKPTFWNTPSIPTHLLSAQTDIKGKGRADTNPNTIPITSSTLQNSTSKYTGTTAVTPTPSTSSKTSTPKSKTRTLPSFNPAFNAYVRHSPSLVAETDHSSWPEGDSQGNWRDVRAPKPKPGPTMRGGAGNVSKKQRCKEEWLRSAFGW